MPASDALIELFGEELQGKSGSIKTADALDGKKNIMIYFSAHWCPPCRGFTPQLAAKYNSSAAANGIEVVFVSSDQDEDGFSSYYGEMPWLALPFADRDRKAKLSEKYEVRGIPSLVVLDPSGILITTEGRRDVDAYFGGAGAAAGPAASPASLTDLFGDELKGKGGTVKTDAGLSGKKFILIYFSAHWCPPCRGFTPTLAEAYSNTLKSKGLEIVFVSSDRDESSFKEYFATMPWLALDYSDSKRKGILSNKFSVSGIPSLVIVGPDGAIINKDGRAEIAEDLEGVHFPWYPKPVPDLKSGPGALNEIPTVVAFCESSTVEVQQSVLEAMKQLALQYIDKMPEGEETASVAFMIATEEGGIAAQLRKIMSLPAKPDGPRVMLIDIPDDGAYYCGPEGEVTAEGVATFVANYENKALIRSRLSKL